MIQSAGKTLIQERLRGVKDRLNGVGIVGTGYRVKKQVEGIV